MLKLIHFVQNLSLDITIGAVIMTLFIAKIFGVELTPPMLMGLSIAIWLIYTVDHLFDAFKAKSTVINPRHAFHQQYFKPMLTLSLFVFVFGIWNMTKLPHSTLLYGLILAGLSVAYLGYSYLSKRPLRKELFAAFIYGAGIATAPLSVLKAIEWYQIVVIFHVFILAYANLLVIPLYESELDIEDKHNSVVTLKGKAMVGRRFLGVCLLSAAICVIELFAPVSRIIPLTFFVMASVLFVLVNNEAWFKRFMLYRILADGIFFLPLIYLMG